MRIDRSQQLTDLADKVRHEYPDPREHWRAHAMNPEAVIGWIDSLPEADWRDLRTAVAVGFSLGIEALKAVDEE
jgi:hypothetical protein